MCKLRVAPDEDGPHHHQEYPAFTALTTVLPINTRHGALRRVASHLSFSRNLFPYFPSLADPFPSCRSGDALTQDMGRSYVQNPPCMISALTLQCSSCQGLKQRSDTIASPLATLCRVYVPQRSPRLTINRYLQAECANGAAHVLAQHPFPSMINSRFKFSGAQRRF